MPSAPDPHSKNTRVTDECLRLLEVDVQEDYCGEDESEMDYVLETGGREDEGVTRGHASRMRENSQKHLGPQEMKPFKVAPPHQVTSAGVTRLFRLLSRSRPRLVRQGERSPRLKGHQGAE